VSEVIVVSHDRHRVVVHGREDDGSWSSHESGPGAIAAAACDSGPAPGEPVRAQEAAMAAVPDECWEYGHPPQLGSTPWASQNALITNPRLMNATRS
jgi:hypothetical protein